MRRPPMMVAIWLIVCSAGLSACTSSSSGVINGGAVDSVTCTKVENEAAVLNDNDPNQPVPDEQQLLACYHAFPPAGAHPPTPSAT
jgi:hypothetical protein